MLPMLLSLAETSSKLWQKCLPVLFSLAETVNDDNADLSGHFPNFLKRLQRIQHPIHWKQDIFT